MHVPSRATSPAAFAVRRSHRSRPLVVTLLLTVLLAASIAGCGSSDKDDRPDAPTVTPAEAVGSPAGPPQTPAGHVVAAPAGARGLVLSGRTLAVLGTQGTSVLLYSAAALAVGGPPPATTQTPELTTLAATGGGAFVGAGPGRVVRIDAAGRMTSTPAQLSAPTTIAVTGDGRILVGTERGHVLVFDRDLRQQHDFGGFVRVDGITVSPRGADLADQQVVVLDRAQSSVTPLDLDNGDLGAALRAGNGATNATVDHYGRVVVANTRDGEIVGFFGSPLVMRFRYPVSDGPYAVDYDDTHDLLWVSTTGDNEVVAYDLADGEPKEKRRFASVAQPDFIAVDDVSSTVYVLSARDGGLQVVGPGE